MKTRYIVSLLVLIVVNLTSSCNKGFLDVSDELAEEMDMEKIFSNPEDVRKFHRNLYLGIPNSMNLAADQDFVSKRGASNIWAYFSDDLCYPLPTVVPNERPIAPTDGRISRWFYYQSIRQANLFMEHAKEIALAGSADYISAEELKDLKAQARFFRAYYHYLLFELYGPIPIMDTAVDPSDPNLDFARNSVDEVVEFIYNELTEVAEELQDPDIANQELRAVPTKGTALAVRARLMVYAASPLFNGGYSEALSLTNPDGKALFPAHDPTKWGRALEATQSFIDYANSGHYELHQEYTDGVLDPHKSLYEVHMKYNKEMIFVRSNDDAGANWTLDKRNVPRGARGGTNVSGALAVTQELVDAFYMVDGLSIEESPLYSESGFSVAGEDQSGKTEVGTYRMFINREPRFYQTVFYNGRKWHVGNEQIWFNDDGNSGRSSGSYYAKTGHLLYKRMSQRVYDEGNHPRTEYRPPVVHRLAEFYLLYAEALNEVDPGDRRIIEYVDKIRARAGIPLLADIKPEIIGNQEEQRTAIRAEMRVELASEGQRYFDLKRWMIADQLLKGPFYGMDTTAPTLEGFYNRVVIHTRDFRRQNYLAPIPLDEIQKSTLLVQNPGY